MGNLLKKGTHELVIATGDRKGGAADNVDVSVTFTDVNGKSHKQKITSRLHNDFRRGKEQKLSLKLPGFEKISAITIRRDDSDEKDDWYIDRIEVNQKEGGRSIFPVNRWVKAQSELSLAEFDSSLPQQDTNKEQRLKELRAKRQKYVFSGIILGAPPQVEYLPDDENFSFSYTFDVVGTLVKDKFKSILIDLTTPEFDSLDDYHSIWKLGLPEPENWQNWKCDIAFGHQKLAGCNPTIIERCQAIPKHLAATAELVEPHLEGKTLADALSTNKMYIIDLTYQAEIECSDDRTLPGSTCLLYQRDNGDLVPVAIQLKPEPAEDNPVFTPADPEYTWMAAKMWMNMSDANHHQSASHLGMTHLLMESVALASNRRLSPSHPMFRLLAPHFLYIMAINNLATTSLVQPDGWIDKAMHMGRIGMFNIIRWKWDRWDLKKDGNLKTNLQERGVDAPGALPNYHYRDDAILLWDAIHKYVSAVVNSVYDSSQKLKEDTELQAWCRELTYGAQMNGVPEEFSRNEELADTMASFIFISSVGHAAANFMQYDQYAFPPKYPSTMHVDMPTTKEALTEEYIVKSLPPKKQTLDVLQVTHVLSQKGTNSLGDYEVDYTFEPKALKALEEFRADLKQVAATIDERNTKRKVKYDYLNPRVVPNAISI